jgi:hypothetical protein
LPARQQAWIALCSIGSWLSRFPHALDDAELRLEIIVRQSSKD